MMDSKIIKLKEYCKDKFVYHNIGISGKEISWNSNKEVFEVFHGVDGSIEEMTEQELECQKWFKIITPKKVK